MLFKKLPEEIKVGTEKMPKYKAFFDGPSYLKWIDKFFIQQRNEDNRVDSEEISSLLPVVSTETYYEFTSLNLENTVTLGVFINPPDPITGASEWDCYYSNSAYGPKQYELLTLSVIADKGLKTKTLASSMLDYKKMHDMVHDSAIGGVAYFFKMLETPKQLHQRSKIIGKPKSHPKRKDYSLQSFVLIKPKTLKTNDDCSRFKPMENRTISISFWVRGHWRKIKGVGKNQYGEPIPNKTWVKSFIKGKGVLDTRFRVLM